MDAAGVRQSSQWVVARVVISESEVVKEARRGSAEAEAGEKGASTRRASKQTATAAESSAGRTVRPEQGRGVERGRDTWSVPLSAALLTLLLRP